MQLEETERRFDEFWGTHLARLKQCLDLRRFEQDFRELQVRFDCIFENEGLHLVSMRDANAVLLLPFQTNFDSHLKAVAEMTEIGETVSRVDTLIWETKTFQKICDADIERAEEVVATGKPIRPSLSHKRWRLSISKKIKIWYFFQVNN